MKVRELRPTEENIRETYLNDTLDRAKDVNAFVDILNTLENSCAIALDGAWGSGKTFFVQQVKMVLDACMDGNTNDDKRQIKQRWSNMHGGKEPEFQTQLCVYYDAWKNDNDEDPILSLVYSILQDVDAEVPFDNESGILEKGAALAELFTGRNVKDIVASLKKENALTELRKKKQIQIQVKEFFDSLLVERAERLVIIVDEVDRCKPEYAVRLLERVKHYFVDDRITFVFATNIQELQYTISNFYGNGFEAVRYFDRFFDLRITLPPINIENYFLNIGFKNTCTVDRVCIELIKMYDLSLREISRFLQMVQIAIYEPTHNSQKFHFVFNDEIAALGGLIYVVPLLIVLNMTDSKTYNQFITGKNPEPLVSLMECIRKKHRHNFKEFLSDKESYENTISQNESNKTLITYRQKFEEVYDAIFGDSYTRCEGVRNVGEHQFSKNSKIDILKAAGLLSVYAQYE